jgi:integrase
MNKRLHEITAWQVEKWRAKIIEAGHKATANRDLTYLKACLERAVEWRHLDANPLANLKRIKEDSNAKIRYLSPEEEEALLAALDARQERQRAERDRYNTWCRDRGYRELSDLRAIEFTDHLKPMVLLSLHTGMRRGEVFNLKWQDIDFTSGTLTVSGATAKSGTSRHIPMNQIVVDTLQAWRRQTEGAELVFPGQNGKPFNNIKKSWAALLKEAKVFSFRWHDMRHDFASKLVMRGVDLFVVSRLLGHSSFAMTQRYAHLAPRIMQDAVNKLLEKSGEAISFEKASRKAAGGRAKE